MQFFTLEDAQREMPIGYAHNRRIIITETRFAKDKAELDLLKKVYDSIAAKFPTSTFPAYFVCNKEVEMPCYKVDGYIYDGSTWTPVQKKVDYNYDVYSWEPIENKIEEKDD